MSGVDGAGLPPSVQFMSPPVAAEHTVPAHAHAHSHPHTDEPPRPSMASTANSDNGILPDLDLSQHNNYSYWSGKNLSSHALSTDVLRTIASDLDPIVMLSLLLALVAVFLCLRYNIYWNVSLALVISPIVFPLAFTINASYARREQALQNMAQIKAAASTLYWSHREWTSCSPCEASPHSTKVLETIQALMVTIVKYLRHSARRNRLSKWRKIYRLLSKLSLLNHALLISEEHHVAPPLVGGAMMHLRQISSGFEQLRNIREYQTPRTIRNFFKFFTFFIPALLSPYFAQLAHEVGSDWGAYYSAVIATVIFGSLQSAQDALDDPFDDVGEDDVNLHNFALFRDIALFSDAKAQPSTIKLQRLHKPECHPTVEASTSRITRCFQRCSSWPRHHRAGPLAASKPKPENAEVDSVCTSDTDEDDPDYAAHRSLHAESKRHLRLRTGSVANLDDLPPGQGMLSDRAQARTQDWVALARAGLGERAHNNSVAV